MNIAIIGGGAAGLMTLASILEHIGDDKHTYITLYEKNSKLGAKIRISGGGRCNITTGKYKKTDLLPAYIRGAEFLGHALTKFGPKKMRRRVEEHGVQTKQEKDGRIFPVSDNGDDVVGIFEKLCKDPRVTVVYKSKISDIYINNIGIDERTNRHSKGGTTEESRGLKSSQDCHVVPPRNNDNDFKSDFAVDTQFTIINDDKKYIYDKVVLATGGNAYAHTGSSGDGYAFARNMGHKITKVGPSLNSFLVSQQRIKDCTGLARPDAKIYIPAQDTYISGPVLMTHFGLSGPAIFAMAAHIAYDEVSQQNPYTIRLILDKTKTYDYWNTVFLEANNKQAKKTLAGILYTYMPKRSVQAFLQAYMYESDIRIGSMSKDMRKDICKKLGNGIDISLVGRRAGDEFVTAGGIYTDEIDATTMQSKICPGLYIVGELANVDGVTGGYNLQASRSMGYAAGKHIASCLS